MITCKNCKHFNVDDDKPFLGFCTIELPAWFRRGINTPDMACTVRADDSCDLGVEKK